VSPKRRFVRRAEPESGGTTSPKDHTTSPSNRPTLHSNPLCLMDLTNLPTLRPCYVSRSLPSRNQDTSTSRSTLATSISLLLSQSLGLVPRTGDGSRYRWRTVYPLERTLWTCASPKRVRRNRKGRAGR
jgi:hypothetical protein